uniref:Uncharacterized protein n=1 Tax=Anguilla anguilla TaxID=7936 RepID=A0A0E9VZY5_ANGAN
MKSRCLQFCLITSSNIAQVSRIAARLIIPT